MAGPAGYMDKLHMVAAPSGSLLYDLGSDDEIFLFISPRMV
jgi:hypothetical protein